MDIDLIFKIAAIGIIVTLINSLLKKADRDDYAFIVSIAGIIIVLLIIIPQIGALFQTIRNVFGLY